MIFQASLGKIFVSFLHFSIWKEKLLLEKQKCHTNSNKICPVYGEGARAERTVQRWFARFKVGDLDLDNQERPSGRSPIDKDRIKSLIENSPRYTTRELTEMLQISKTTIRETFCEAWIRTPFWCTGFSQFNGKKSDDPYFHSQLALWTRRGGSIFEASSHERWKMDYL